MKRKQCFCGLANSLSIFILRFDGIDSGNYLEPKHAKLYIRVSKSASNGSIKPTNLVISIELFNNHNKTTDDHTSTKLKSLIAGDKNVLET